MGWSNIIIAVVLVLTIGFLVRLQLQVSSLEDSHEHERRREYAESLIAKLNEVVPDRVYSYKYPFTIRSTSIAGWTEYLTIEEAEAALGRALLLRKE